MTTEKKRATTFGDMANWLRLSIEKVLDGTLSPADANAIAGAVHEMLHIAEFQLQKQGDKDFLDAITKKLDPPKEPWQ